MPFFDQVEINRIKGKYYNPRDPIDKLFYKDPKTRINFTIAIVCDNKDPDKLGRLKVYFPLYDKNMISPWIHQVRFYAGPDRGIWSLPEIGQKALCGFFESDMSFPIVLGILHSPRKPPPVKDNTGNNIKIFSSPSGNSLIILDDTEGKERIIISTEEGKICTILESGKGISIVNKVGDIEIECENLEIKGENITIAADKKFELSADEIIIEGASLTGKSGKDIILKGSKVDFKRSSVTAENKQIAVKGDKVMGIDTHDELVPAPPGPPVKIPFPNPYMGELKDKLSTDVKIGGKGVAVKGSKSKALGPGHIVIPPGIQFAKPPSNEGEVTMETVPSVKVNGKEVAVIGSKVKTCGDPSDMENGSILAVGMAFGVPPAMLGLDPGEFEPDELVPLNSSSPVDNGPPKEDKKRSLSNPVWSENQAAFGEEVRLNVNLTNQYENAGVYFKIWEEEADRDKDQPVAVVVGSNRGGKASAKTRIRRPEAGAAPYPEAEVIAPLFTIKGIQSRLNALAHNCGKVDGIRGSATTRAVESFQESNGLTVDGIPGKNTQSKLEEEYNKSKSERERQSSEEDTRKYFFTAKSFRCKEVESGPISLSPAHIDLRLVDDDGLPAAGEFYIIIEADGRKKSGRLDDEGLARVFVRDPEECKIIYPNQKSKK